MSSAAFIFPSVLPLSRGGLGVALSPPGNNSILSIAGGDSFVSQLEIGSNLTSDGFELSVVNSPVFLSIITDLINGLAPTS